jgi:dienelactone hydrolase
VHVPILLIVGGMDRQVIEMNKDALAKMPDDSEKEITIVPGATHLFEEPGTLEQVARLARDWFKRYLTSNEKD